MYKVDSQNNGEVKDVTVTQAQLARALGVSTPRINQLIDEGAR